MMLYLKDQKNNFKQHLSVFMSQKVMDYDIRQLTNKITSIDIETNKKIEELNLNFLFNYEIFPSNMMAYFNQWEDENRKMSVGDTIVQQVSIPPVNSLSLKLIIGVKINKIINQYNQKGFSYETLVGHVEKGISTFTIEQLDSKVIFKIQTYSEPGNILTKFFGPLITTPYQSYCTKCALLNVKQQLEKQ